MYPSVNYGYISYNPRVIQLGKYFVIHWAGPDLQKYVMPDGKISPSGVVGNMLTPYAVNPGSIPGRGDT